MKNLLLTVFLMVVSQYAIGQVTSQPTPEEVIAVPEEPPMPPPVEDERPFYRVERMPSFPGGEKELLNYLAQNIRYPPIASKNGIEGKVVLRFVIDKVGTIKNIEVLEDVGGGCTEEALRVVKSMPTWSPGNANSKPVNVYYTLPINFKLTDPDPSTPSTVNTSASFPGGETVMWFFLSKNTNYPKKAKNKKIEGTVIVDFVVGSDGSLSDFRIVKGLGYGCDEEALKVVKSMPRWSPAQSDGKPYEMKVVLSVKFKLD